MHLKLWCISLFCLLKLFLFAAAVLSRTPNNYFTVWFCSTVESQFFKPPWERPIYSNYREAWNIGRNITMFDHWREVTLCLFELLVISKNQWFEKSGFYFIFLGIHSPDLQCHCALVLRKKTCGKVFIHMQCCNLTTSFQSTLQNEHALRYVYVLSNLCEEKIPAQK